MIYKAFNNINLSCLGMGNMRLPMKKDSTGTFIDRVKAQEIIDYAMDNGINYYDTAYVYNQGDSEKFLGEAFQKYPRDSFYFATKFNLYGNPDFKEVFKEQLKRLKTDYIDFYLIHSISDSTYQKYIDMGCIEYFLEQKRMGRIKYLGFSSHASVKSLEAFADHHKWDFAQLQLNYFDWRYSTAKAEYEALEKRDIPIIVMEPIRGGRLAVLSPLAESILKESQPNWSVASWALRWVKRLPQVYVILSGMSTLDQIKENVSTFKDDRALTDEEETLVMKACDVFRKEVSVPCTSCRYCIDGCPEDINIPEFLEVYNKFKTDGRSALSAMKNIDSKGQPKDCISCDACFEVCPQNIDVKVVMKELAEFQKD